MNSLLPGDRRTARLHNSKVYFTGRACPQGHVVCRYTSNGACSACVGTPIEAKSETTIDLKQCRRCGALYVSRCTECKRRLRNAWAERNRAYLADRQRERVQGCRERLRDYKESNPCLDCGKNKPWYLMEFDHVHGRGPGDSTVGSLVGQGTWSKIEAEMGKCDLVCVECHAIRTHFRAVEAGLRIPDE
jgi:hypothetical protein